MLTDKEILDHHPEIVAAREFKTGEEIIHAFKDGGEMWRAVLPLWRDPAPACYRLHVYGLEIYDGPVQAFHGDVMFCYYEDEYPDIPQKDAFCDLQDYPGEGVFTTEVRAREFLKVIEAAYESDPEWQKREWSDEYFALQYRVFAEILSSCPALRKENAEDMLGAKQRGTYN